MEENGPQDPRAGRIDVVIPQLQVEYSKLSEDLFEMGSGEGVKKANRDILYRLSKRFKDVASDVFPRWMLPQFVFLYRLKAMHICKASHNSKNGPDAKSLCNYWFCLQLPQNSCLRILRSRSILIQIIVVFAYNLFRIPPCRRI